jgi:hypothetical protein
MSDLGIHLNCGSFRPRWFRAKTRRKQVTVSFSLEVPEKDSDESLCELREKINEAIVDWSRLQWCKLQKRKREKKKEEKHGL